MKRQKYLISIVLIMLILGITNVSNATIISDRYTRWSQLSKAEKNNSIQPNMYSININEGIKDSNKNKFSKLKDSLQEKYFLKDNIKVNVKNQQTTNTCWAFSAISCLETNITIKSKKESQLYSARHMDYATSKTFKNNVINPMGFNRELKNGGNPVIAFTYFVNGTGPVLEKDMPFENNENQIDIKEINKKVSKKVLDYTEFPSIYKEYDANGKLNKYTDGGEEEYSEKDVQILRTAIKNHIKENGAVTAYTYAALNSEQDFKKYYNIEELSQTTEKNCTYYCNDTQKSADHALTIVGWDDTYSKSNFKIEPKNDGAYIVLNSWGEKQLNDGYMYVSYDDVNIENMPMGICNTEDINYDTIYQHDKYGCSNKIAFNSKEKDEQLKALYLANVFNRDKSNMPKDNKNYSEYINEISIYVANACDIEIYLNANSDDKTKIEKVATPGVLESGYHTIKLSSPVKLTGDKFVVAARYSNSEGVEVPVEYNWLTNEKESTYWDVVTSNKEESFIAQSVNQWTDFTSESLNLKNTNACIKAFTTFEEDKDIKVSSITLNKVADTMQVGDTKNLVATINPTNATNQKVTWKSSNEEVATISSTGIITAIKEGTTDIIVTSTDGSNKSATCKITVKAKTNTDDDKYKVKDDVNDEEIKVKSNTDNDGEIKSKELNNNKLQSNEVKDPTTANKILPNTGKLKIIVSFILIAVIGVIVFIKFRKMKDIK